MQNKSRPTVTKAAAHEDLPAYNAGRSPYQITASQKNVIMVPIWLEKHQSDPAVKNFLPQLKSHLLAQILGDRYKEEIDRTSFELIGVQLQHDRIYAHQTLKLHYTAYDVRRSQDVVHPNTSKRFILVSSGTLDTHDVGAHQFWYAKVLGIYHANVSYKGSRPKQMDFLWVRWLSRMVDLPGGWDTCRLDQLGYFPDSELDHAFDFVNPLDVVRATHLLPRFAGGRTTDYLKSVNSLAADDPCLGDWNHFYVGLFADCDMLIRFIGSGIGHMTLGRAPELNVGVSADTLGKGSVSGEADYQVLELTLDHGYEYNEESTLANRGTYEDIDSGINDQGEVGDDESKGESKDECDEESNGDELVGSVNGDVITSDGEEGKDVEW